MDLLSEAMIVVIHEQNRIIFDKEKESDHIFAVKVTGRAR
jgi:hypothetical protein